MSKFDPLNSSYQQASGDHPLQNEPTKSTSTRILPVFAGLVFIGVVIAIVVALAGGGDNSSSSASIAPISGPLTKYTVTSTDAVCNDGSQGIYYVRDSGSDKWIIYIQGGTLYCWDTIGCDVRWNDNPELMTSTLADDEMDVDGIMSSDCDVNPEFCDYNIGFAYYCSSDYWSGNNDASNTEAGQHFKGFVILSEIINHLLEDHGLSSASEILLAGKGGGGVALNFAGRRVVEQIQEATDAPIKGVMDTGWLIDQDPFQESFGECTNYTSYDQCNFRSAITHGIQNDAWNPVFPSYCTDNAYSWQCYFSFYMFADLEEILGEVYVFSFQYDYAQAGTDGLNLFADPIPDEEMDYATEAAQNFIENEIEPQVSTGMFPDCWNHEIIDNGERMHSIELDGVSFYDHFADWYLGSSDSSLLHDGPDYVMASNPSC